MKFISTLFVAVAALFSLKATAQYTQNFETATSLTTGCVSSSTVEISTTTSEVITGLGSLLSNPPVNGNGTRDFSSPYLNVIDQTDSSALTAPLTVSFNFKLNTVLNGNATRTIEIGLIDGSGNFSSLYIINMDRNYTPTTTTFFTQTFYVAAGVYRLALKMGGSTGLGTARTIIDDLVVSADPYYNSLGNTCNPAPAIVNDIYYSLNIAPYTGTTVLANDSDPGGETLSAPVISTTSPDGTVVMNPDGTFTFTPYPTFTGPTTSFTYLVYDNGYSPVADSAIVTIVFGAAAPLPIKLISFQGALVNEKAQLKWLVDANETGEYFELEKSTDGRNYSSVSILFATEKAGTESYSYNEPTILERGTFYRLKIVNLDNSIAYSKVVFLRPNKDVASGGIKLLQNPVQSEISFSYHAEESGPATVTIYNILGARIQTYRVQLQKGSNALSYPADSRMTPGTYVLEVTTTTSRSAVKLVK